MKSLKKDVTFQGHACRVGKLDPLSALRIVSVLQSAQLSAAKKLSTSSRTVSPSEQQPTAAQTSELIALIWAIAGFGISEEEQRRVQQLCLITCEAKNERSGMYERVMADDGRWVQDEVADNLQLINFLVVETLKYNLTSFFLDGASEPEAKASPASVPSAASKSILTSGVRS
jgi:hypothetical protein